MKNFLLISFLLLSLPGLAYSQERGWSPQQTSDYPRHSLYLEYAGHSPFLSLNYDLLFPFKFGIRGSISGWPSGENPVGLRSLDGRSVLGMISILKFFGKDIHFFETGAGFAYGNIENKESWQLPLPPSLAFSAGYRLYPDEANKSTIKLAFTPLVPFDGKPVYRFGISIGVTLSR
ncbi:MAG: hypothetical protein WD604_11275 [Balneolaceae bacterium]